MSFGAHLVDPLAWLLGPEELQRQILNTGILDSGLRGKLEKQAAASVEVAPIG